MELKVICIEHITVSNKNKVFYSILSELEGPMIAIYSGYIKIQDILFGTTKATDGQRVKITKDLLEQVKSAKVVSESILWPYDTQFFLQKNKDGTLSDIRDGHKLDL